MSVRNWSLFEWGEFDPNLIATTGASTTSGLGEATGGDGIFAALKKMQEAANAIPKPDFDVIVCIRETLPDLQRMAEYEPPSALPGAMSMPCGGIRGIPVHVYESLEEAIAACIQFSADGKRPVFVNEKVE